MRPNFRFGVLLFFLTCMLTFGYYGLFRTKEKESEGTQSITYKECTELNHNKSELHKPSQSTNQPVPSHDLGQTPNTSREYTVAYWNVQASIDYYGKWRDLFEAMDCPVRCKVIEEFANSNVKVDALISAHVAIAPSEHMARAQRNVLFLMEALVRYDIAGMKRPFDYTSFYTLDSDIPFPYREFKNETSFMQIPGTKKTDVLVAAFISNDVQWRTDYIKELMKYVKIDHYGRVLKNTEIGVPVGDRSRPAADQTPMDLMYLKKLEILRQYKFTLAFENVQEQDYVTEKLYHPFMAASVPIYKGAPNVRDFLPGPHSAVLVDEFASPKDLAEYLIALAADERRYQQYFEYQKYGISARKTQLVDIYTKYSLPCMVCMKLSKDSSFPSTKGVSTAKD